MHTKLRPTLHSQSEIVLASACQGVAKVMHLLRSYGDELAEHHPEAYKAEGKQKCYNECLTHLTNVF